MELIKGDCHELLKELDENSIDLCLTDPPYAITGASSWSDQPLQWDLIWEELYRIGKEDTPYVFTASESFTVKLINSNFSDYRYKWTWLKKGSANAGFHFAHIQPIRAVEDILVFYRKAPTYNPQWDWKEGYTHNGSYKASENYHLDSTDKTNSDGRRYPNNILDFNTIPTASSNRHHSTQKPVDLLRYLIRTYTDEDETVLDFTMGSGSTGVAAVNEGRDFIGIEKESKYYDIAKDRIKNAERDYEQKKRFFDL